MGLGIFLVSATDVGDSTAVGVSTSREGSIDEGASTDVGDSTAVGVSTGREGSIDEGASTDVGDSTGREGSTDEGDEVCVSGVFNSGLSATRLSLLAVGADWGFCDFFVFFAAIRESVGFFF
jgi:hypothetical protein